MIESLQSHGRGLEVFVLALDRQVFEALTVLGVKGVSFASLQDLERADPELLSVKSERTTIEYYFTLTPCLPFWILENDASIDMVVYLDADLYFCSDPMILIAEMGSADVGLVSHRWSRALEERGRLYGFHNVSFIAFRRGGSECLKWYRTRCIEWCFDRVEGARYADQKYLDAISARFRNVVTLMNRGANVASWNLEDEPLHGVGETICIGEDEVVYFHFHSHTFRDNPYGLALTKEMLMSAALVTLCDEYLTAVGNWERRLVSECAYGVGLQPHRGETLPRSIVEVIASRSV